MVSMVDKNCFEQTATLETKNSLALSSMAEKKSILQFFFF
jgi:hypothetical protein